MRTAIVLPLVIASVLASAPPAVAQTRNAPPTTAPTSAPATRPAGQSPEPETLPGLHDELPFFPDTTYDPAVPTPGQLLGPDVGRARRPALPQQVVACLLAWQGHPRVKLVQIGESHQGRPLYAAIVTSEANHTRLDEIQRGWQRLSDSRDVPETEANELARALPPVAWLGYSIHGNETSGTDAAVQLLYHLIAGVDEATTKLLDDTIVIIDPALNPDGRQRHLSQQEDARTRAPAVDDQDNQATGDTPPGRTNHYGFDLNRDWLYATQPETRARMQFLLDWHPLLMVDAHEMGSQDTYLFGPGREPINPHLPPARRALRELFARELGQSFDARGWRYYSGEWAEEWYPGYSDSWGTYRGAVGVLYEQSHRGVIGVRRPEGFIATYRNGVHQQAQASLANLQTLHRHRDRLRAEFVRERRANVSADAPSADRAFVFPSTGNVGREAQLAELLRLQGIEAYVSDAELTLPRSVDAMGNAAENRRVPAGALVVPNRQPNGPYVSAALEFDTRLSPPVLTLERQRLLRGEEGLMYDVTGWSVALYFGLEAYEARMPLPQQGLRRLGANDPWPASQPSAGVDRREATVGFVIDGRDDRSVAAAGRLMERGVEVKVALRSFKFAGRTYARGSILISRQDNQNFAGDMVGVVDEVAERVGIVAFALDSGAGEPLPSDETDPADAGGAHFRRLEPPRIAVFTRGPAAGYSGGEVWHTIDQRLGLRATYLNTDFGGYFDLRRYNVIVLPDLPAEVIEPMRAALAEWVRAGGTLIATDASSAALADAKAGIGSTRKLEDAIGDLAAYEQAVLRELEADRATVDLDRLYDRGVPARQAFPWDTKAQPAAKEELARRDSWQKLFAPQGVLVAARVNDHHWLTVGTRDDAPLPVLIGNSLALMAGDGVEAPVRLGLVTNTGNPATGPASAPATLPATQPEEEKDAAPGEPATWVNLPAGVSVQLRMSGLLWPDYAGRIAHVPYVTRERIGAGQIILFADDPAFRGATLGTMRLLTNALVYGPGCGAQPPILP